MFKANYAADFPELRIYSSHTEMLAAEQLDVVGVLVEDHLAWRVRAVDCSHLSRVKGVLWERALLS